MFLDLGPLGHLMMMMMIIIVMAIKTSGCPDILNNDWAASRS